MIIGFVAFVVVCIVLYALYRLTDWHEPPYFRDYTRKELEEIEEILRRAKPK